MSQSDLAWSRQAACKGRDQTLWFGKADPRTGTLLPGGSGNQAKAICASCPVRLQCLTYAIDPPPPPIAEMPALTGIWGGLSIENAERIGLPGAWAMRQCDGQIPLDEDGRGCRWCVLVREHFASLPGKGATAIRRAGPSRNGPNAVHGVPTTHARGCRDGHNRHACDDCSSEWSIHERRRKANRRAEEVASVAAAAKSRHGGRMTLVAEPTDALAGLAVPGVAIGPTGLHVDENVSEEDVDQVGRGLATIDEASSWSIADWLLAKDSRFKRRYGESCALIGLSYESWASYPVVAERVPVERRRADLTFSHHAMVAHRSAEDQVEYLAWAARDGEPDEAGARPQPYSALALRRKVKDDEQADRDAVAATEGYEDAEDSDEEAEATEDQAAKLLGSATVTPTVQCQPVDLAEAHAMLRRMADGLEAWSGPDNRDLSGFSVLLDPSEPPK